MMRGRRAHLALAAVAAGLMAVPAAADAASPSPRLGRTAVVELSKGTVRVKERGERRFARLTGRRAIPLGSTVDTSRGRVRLTTAANRSGRKQSGLFSEGAFVVTQTRGRAPVTELRLTGEIQCPSSSGRPLAGTAQRRIRRLRGSARGRFRSRGRHSSATVRGTVWTTEDRCDGTEHRTEDGEVVVSDGSSTFTLPEGFIALWYCEPVDAGPLERHFCLITLGNGDLWGFAIAARTDLNNYQFCVLNPYEQVVCRDFQFDSSFYDVQGGEVRYGDVFCLASDGPGLYFGAWGFNNEVIGIPLPFIVTVPPREGACPFDQEEVGLPESGVSRSAFRALRERVSSLRGRTLEALPRAGGSLGDALRARSAGGR
jgi:hypothetical protein